MNLTQDDVREIIRLLDESPFDELEVQSDRMKLTLRRAAGAGWTQETRSGPADKPAHAVAAEGPAAVVLEPGLIAVTAPLVGATRLDHLDDAVAATELELSGAECERLERPYRPRRPDV